jgi:hypothetical protein
MQELLNKQAAMLGTPVLYERYGVCGDYSMSWDKGCQIDNF